MILTTTTGWGFLIPDIRVFYVAANVGREGRGADTERTNLLISNIDLTPEDTRLTGQRVSSWRSADTSNAVRRRDHILF